MSSIMKYGVIFGEPKYSYQAPMYGAEVLSAKSGRYVIYDRDLTYWKACTTGESYIGGYVEQSLTCSTTSGITVLPVAVNVWEFATELPYATAGAAATLTAAVLKTLIGTACDLYATGNIQYADAAVTTDSLFIIVGGNVAHNSLYVVVQPAKVLTVA